ncbi:hypothetical protein [Streptomyces sp. ITFR-16]|nr:hypothetical protein [Streptomyces sp. ITFR-16]WNI27237.1 hypothetical protein RLT58_35445 [Streptomyces sp. ITFR-16]
MCVPYGPGPGSRPRAHRAEGNGQVNDEPAQEAQSDEDIGWPRR